MTENNQEFTDKQHVRIMIKAVIYGSFGMILFTIISIILKHFGVV